MKSATSAPFTLRGGFAGFIRTAAGKRRLLLRAAGEELRLKVPKLLRRELAKAAGLGSEIEVAGVELRSGERVKRLVSRLRIIIAQPVAPAPCAGCRIRVCTRANCWDQGGRELWQRFEEELADAGLTRAVELKGVRCLGRCQRAPTMAFRGRYHGRCQPSDAAAVVAEITARLRASH